MIPKKKRGRPKSTGSGEQVGVRWHEPDLERIDAWAKAQDPELTRAEAIRRLVDMGLKASAKKDGLVTITGRASKRMKA